MTVPGRVGIMGGTFDPIHYGHLVAANIARAGFGLDRVIFVPAARPPHKEEWVVSDPEHRYLMTVLATVTNPWFVVSRLELDRPGPSYTIETISAFRGTLGPEVELFFITGADAIMELCTWKDSSELLGMCQFIAATRPGYPLAGLESLEARYNRGPSRRIFRLEVPGLAISSSDIRARVAAGEPITYLVPEPVEDYISKHRLYRVRQG